MVDWWIGEEITDGLLLRGHNEVLHDVIFALGSVLAHVETEDAGGVGFWGVFDLAEAHFLANELLEFGG